MTISPSPSNLKWRTVGPHWCSVQQGASAINQLHNPPSIHESTAALSSIHRGMHSSYMNAIASSDFIKPEHNLKYPLPNNSVVLTIPKDPCPVSVDDQLLDYGMHEYKPKNQQYTCETHSDLSTDHKHDQSPIQSSKSGTALHRPWFPTFGLPGLSSTCSNRTIALPSSQQYNSTTSPMTKQSVGPRWRSINTPSPAPSTPNPSNSSMTFNDVLEKQENRGFLQRATDTVLTVKDDSSMTSLPSSPSPSLEQSSYPNNILPSQILQPNQNPGRDMTDAMDFLEGANTERRQYNQWSVASQGNNPISNPIGTNEYLTEAPRYSNLQRGQLGGGYSYRRCMKRKAGSQDEEMSDSQVVQNIGGYQNGGEQSQMDEDMSSMNGDYVGDTSTTSYDSNSGNNYDRMDYSINTDIRESVSNLSKKTRPRLDVGTFYGSTTEGEMETKRQESERKLDIFQECFYNAGAMTSR